MKVTLLVVFLCLISFFVGRGSSMMSVVTSGGTTRYDNPMMNAKGTKFVKLDNGALVEPETKAYYELSQNSDKRGSYDKLTTVDLGNGLYTIGSESIVNSHFIIGRDGVIIYDTGDNLSDGQTFYNEMRKVTSLPIKAIIYSHEHYTLGSKVYIDEEKKRGNTSIKIIGHPKLNEVMATTGGVQALHPEVGGVLMARSIEQFNFYLPDEGPDGRFKNTIVPANQGFVPVNTPVRDKQRMSIAGLDLVFYTEGVGTDTSNQVMVYVPAKRAVLNNVMWGWFPNIYSLRGGRYRNPKEWMHSVELIKQLKPEIVMSTHSTSVKGRDKVEQRLQNYQDGLAFVLDQTLKGISLGLGPDELNYFVKLPDYLKEEPLLIENYGPISTMPARIFTATFGQFDRNATTLFKLHPEDEAGRMISSMGGEGRVRSLAKQAFDNGDFQWSCQLSDYLVKAYKNKDNLKAKADCLREIGKRSFATTARSWALSQAREAEGKVSILKNAPADVTQVKSNLADFVNYFRIRINPDRSSDTHEFVSLDFGSGKKYGLNVRNAVVEFVDDQRIIDKNKTLELQMKPETWAMIYNNISSVDELLQNDQIVAMKGSQDEIVNIFAKFDPVYDWQNDPALKQLANRTIASESEN